LLLKERKDTEMGTSSCRWIASLLVSIALCSACKKHRGINVDDIPKASGSGSSSGSGTEGSGKGKEPLSEKSDRESQVEIDVQARAVKSLNIEERVAKAETALLEIKDNLLGAKDETLSNKWDVALASWSAIPKIKPEESIARFCNDMKILVDAAIADSGLLASSKGKIGDAYVRVLHKKEGACTTKE